MADRYVVMGQIYVADVDAGIDISGRKVADTNFTCTGAGTFKVYMANGTTGTLSGTNVQGTPVALAAGENTITTTGAVADGVIDITIGTAANTNDVNSWAASSGGQCGASIPTSADNFYADANSFTAGSQVLTVNATANCLNLDFTGATNTPTLAFGTNRIGIYGNATFILGMSTSYTSGNGLLIIGADCNLTTNGLTLSCPVRYNTAACKLTLLDDLTTTQDITLSASTGTNTLVTSNKNVTASYFKTGNAGAKVITLGSSIITLSSSTGWDVATGGGAVTFTANTATINCSGNAALGDADYNGATLNLTGATSTVKGSPTGLAAFNLASGTTQTITFTAGQNITADDFALDGSAGHVHTLTSTGAYTLTKAGGGIVSADYLSLTYCQGAPASTFYRKANVTYGIGNSGWTPYQSSDMRLVDTSPLEANRRRISGGV